MAKPVILTVDDDPEVLQAVTRDLHQEYALLKAYADTNAVIRAINLTSIDYYLMKPWYPPEKLLYPVLNDIAIHLIGF